MFASTAVFNGDIGSWNVGKVKNMAGMFSLTNKFIKNIGNWDVSNVTMMGYMFQSAKAFNMDISNWNVSKVTNMTQMFLDNKIFFQDLTNWASTGGGFNVNLQGQAGDMFSASRMAPGAGAQPAPYWRLPSSPFSRGPYTDRAEMNKYWEEWFKP